jgi:hypothetical protein
MMRWTALILLFTVPVLSARAQESAPEVDEIATTHADGLIAFADASEAAGDGGLAIEALERFLESFPFDSRVSDVTARLAALRKSKTRVRIESAHVRASVWIEGSKVADRTPAEITLPEGRHQIIVTARDGRSTVLDVVLPPASRRTLQVTFPGDFDPLEQARFGVGGTLVVEAPKEEKDEAEAKRRRRRVLALAGVSSTALVFTGVFGMMALADAEEFRRDPSEKVARRGERSAIFADVSLGVAVAAGVAALVFQIKDRDKKPAPSVSVLPAVTRDGAALVMRGGL